MNQFLTKTLAASVIVGAGMTLFALPASAETTAAQSVTKECSTKYNAAKDAGTLNGQKWPQFLSTCSASLKTDAAAPAPAAAAPTAKQAKETAKPAKAQAAAPATAGTMSAKAVTKECSTQYQASKSAGTLNGQKWPQFLSACSDSLKSDQSDAATPPEPTVAPTKASASKAATAPETSASGKPLSAGEIAFRSRIRECGEEWQKAKASNKVAGQTWPQYWSACNTRLKAE
ncbi:hypothetical protein [Phyllobacterium myrsinacearum]|uniref:Antifreeze protein n=1 Tax=Phyllobacterium myrsinacearum TaxID=28101 RepID=A0A839EJH7_9HYPH|nr:hypothetical protein [Phyllobacterium myrsinacearum]MBA8880151.1 hypothetical protein [Phyllobacterium myrsinacearum]